EIAQHGVRVPGKMATVESRGRFAVHLCLQPAVRVLTERDFAEPWVHVLAGHDRRCDLVKPSLCVALELEVPGVLPPRVVAVAGTPDPVRTLLDACHQSPAVYLAVTWSTLTSSSF